MSTSQTVVITGGNTGLGFEAAKNVARDRSTLVVIACRNPAFGETAVAALKDDGGNATFLPIDLGVQDSVRQFVDLFRKAAMPPLSAIIANAGIQNFAEPQKSAEGYETTFVVNHLGHYLLARLLLDDLTADGRITFVSSCSHDPAQRTFLTPPVYENADVLAHDFEPGRSAGMRRYTTSKLCNIFCTYELSRRLAATGNPRLKTIKVNTLDPGMMPSTGLVRTWPAPVRPVLRIVLPLVGLFKGNVHTPQTSGERLAKMTVGPEAAPGGRYFSDGKAVRSSALSYDQDKQRELWISSARMTGLPVELAGP